MPCAFKAKGGPSFERALRLKPCALSPAKLPVLAASIDIPLSDIGLYELRDRLRSENGGGPLCNEDGGIVTGAAEAVCPNTGSAPTPVPSADGRPEMPATAEMPATRSGDVLPTPRRPGRKSDATAAMSGLKTPLFAYCSPSNDDWSEASWTPGNV